ncbi:MAG TPA: protein phosphatase 2C domain-containing protein, partial [Gemmata sp.]|nr:protein phosphatase 2C domain-containing protein [Gemmata sp.]
GQLGDGAAVVSKDERYLPVFWPQSGEYANTTYFLTDPSFEKHVEFARWDEMVSEFAIMTDGLQRLALDYSTKLGHRGFFHPLFRDLRASVASDQLDGPLAEFLDCPRVNQRTDDDKTLILATRLSPCAPINHPL